MILQVCKQTAFFHDFRFMTFKFPILELQLVFKTRLLHCLYVVPKYLLFYLVLLLAHLVRGSSPKPVFRTTNFTAVGSATINLTNCGAGKFVLNQVGENLDFWIYLN